MREGPLLQGLQRWCVGGWVGGVVGVGVRVHVCVGVGVGGCVRAWVGACACVCTTACAAFVFACLGSFCAWVLRQEHTFLRLLLARVACSFQAYIAQDHPFVYVRLRMLPCPSELFVAAIVPVGCVQGRTSCCLVQWSVGQPFPGQHLALASPICSITLLQ
jgi:hypothetical protein